MYAIILKENLENSAVIREFAELDALKMYRVIDVALEKVCTTFLTDSIESVQAFLNKVGAFLFEPENATNFTVFEYAFEYPLYQWNEQIQWFAASNNCRVVFSGVGRSSLVHILAQDRFDLDRFLVDMGIKE